MRKVLRMRRWRDKIKEGLREKQKINYVCLVCNETEGIPYDTVRYFDEMDEGDLTVPPRFSCEKCGGEMYPEYYEGV